MSVNLSQKDWLLISSYLDARLSASEAKAFEERLKYDASLNQAYLEIRYTKKMLGALPVRRAPRNFTLSTKQVKKPLSQRIFQPALSFVSAGAAVACAAVFMFTFFAPRAAALPAAEAADRRQGLGDVFRVFRRADAGRPEAQRSAAGHRQGARRAVRKPALAGDQGTA